LQPEPRSHSLAAVKIPWLAVSCAVVACACAPPVRFATGPCPAPPADGHVTVERFYRAFSQRDFTGMACAYDPEVEFTDPVFGTLRGKRALAMWAMLTSQGTDLVIRYADVRADGATGHAHWDATYTFTFLTFPNQVDNHVDATFELRDGRILRHHDVFDLKRWMSEALSPLGGVVSESTIRNAVRKKLDDFIADHPEFQDAPAPAARP
jgi:limonene-1,2-epoxide hydrolase